MTFEPNQVMSVVLILTFSALHVMHSFRWAALRERVDRLEAQQQKQENQ